jgi:hypothetical protein
MSGSDSLTVKQLETAIEEDREIIRKLRLEVDRLRYLLGLDSLRNLKKETPTAVAPHPRTHQLHPDYSN